MDILPYIFHVHYSQITTYCSHDSFLRIYNGQYKKYNEIFHGFVIFLTTTIIDLDDLYLLIFSMHVLDFNKKMTFACKKMSQPSLS